MRTDMTDKYNIKFIAESAGEEYLAEALTDLVEASIDHGGDYGGPYYSNFEGLEGAVSRVCRVINETAKQEKEE